MKRPSLLYHGPFERLSSFTLVNRQLAAGLCRKGWDLTVMPTDRPARGPRRRPLPDLYFFNGHPYDLIDAPGRVNVFHLPYDYARFVPADRLLAPALNARFDRLVVPSRFTKAACERSGVSIPIDVCPHGVDAGEIWPGAAPIAWPSTRSLRFLYLGGAYERKGTDLLLRAYLGEFSARDDVSLLIKAFSYDHLQPWMRARLTALGVGRAGSAEVVYEHGNAASVAGYYTAAHAGVFPFRGEGFGLPVLECLASGRPAIVTRGCGPLDFCREPFARFLDARPVRRSGREELEPDVDTLRALLRDAYRRGPVTAAEAEAIRASVEGFTWTDAVNRLDASLREAWIDRAAARRPRARSAASGGRAAGFRVAYAFRETGLTSWRKASLRIHTALRRRFAGYAALPFPGPASSGPADVVVGQSGFCLEAFRVARDRNRESRLLMHTGSAPIEESLGIINRERARCGVAPLEAPPIQLWRHRHETALADTILVESSVARDFFVRAGHPSRKIRVLPPGIDVAAQPRARRGGRRRRLRLLFVATDPFRKGVRLLFQAWRRVRPARAELICVAGPELLTSRRLLRVLVTQPDIVVMPLRPYRQLQALYDGVDCLVLPSLEDGFAFAVAEGMGRGVPAIVSSATGVRDLIVHGENGYVVRSGSVSDLASVLAQVSEERHRLPAAGESARETARRYPWRRFEAGLIDCVEGR